MRPLRLEIEGFTVYKKPQVIDFERLNFFVIQGKTGAGKTSIVDAITYALYGKVPRYGEANATEMVLSKGGNRLRVSLEFSVGGKRYRIERFYRKKPKEKIVRVEEEGRRLNLKGREVEDWIQRITGLDYKTFTKVILLPQGEWSRLLKPKEPRERREILINLLNLDVFERMRELASERFRELEGELGALRAEMEAGLKDIDETSLEGLREEKERREREAEGMRGKIGELEELLRRARERERLVEELSDIEGDLKSLEEDKGRIEGLRERVERAKYVRPYLPYLERVESLERELKELRVKEEKLTKTMMALHEEMENVREEMEKVEKEFERLPTLRDELLKCERELLRLEEAKKELLSAEKLREEIRVKEGKLSERERDYKEYEGRLSKGESLIEEVRKELEGLGLIEKEYEELVEKAERRRSLLRDLERLRKVEKELEEKRKGKELLRRELDLKRLELERKEEERKMADLRAHAMHLRSLLKEGDRCPVCGGVFEGGTFVEEGVDLEGIYSEVERLRSEVLELQKRFTSLEAETSALERERESLSSQLEKERELLEEEVEERLRDAKERMERRRKLEEKLRVYQDRWSQLLKERESALRDLESLRSEVASLKKVLEEKEARVGGLNLSQIEDEIARLKDKKEGLEGRVREVERRREEVRSYFGDLSKRLIAVETELKNAQELGRRMEEERKENLRRLAVLFEEFGGLDRVREFALPEEEVLRIEREVEDFQRKRELLEKRGAEVRAKLEELGEIPPSEEVEGRLALLKGELEEVIRRIGELGKEIERFRELLERKVRVEERMKELERELRLYSRLKEDLRSDRLQDFVSNLMLKRIAERASDYMLSFTGNYELLIDGNGDLVVFDRSQGTEREVLSLSGGETFLASLSLALGVSDVLSANSHLESLFIDEGFGSLDEETRERVSDILELVKQRINRMVGIISHIPDLAERFHQRIVVKKHGDFSTLEVFY